MSLCHPMYSSVFSQVLKKVLKYYFIKREAQKCCPTPEGKDSSGVGDQTSLGPDWVSSRPGRCQEGSQQWCMWGLFRGAVWEW